MKVLNIFIFILGLLSCGQSLFAVKQNAENNLKVSEYSKNQEGKRGIMRKSYSSGDLSSLKLENLNMFKVKFEKSKKIKNNYKHKKSTFFELMNKGNFLEALKILGLSFRNYQIDNNIIHSILISKAFDCNNIELKRESFLKEVIDMFKVYFSEASKVKLINNKCEIVFGGDLSEEMTPMSIALENNNLEIIEFLFSEGVQKDALSANDKLYLLNLKKDN